MTTWKRTQGDIGDTICAVLDGVVDLTAVTSIEAHVQYGSDTPVTLSAGVLDATDRTVLVQLGGVAGWLETAKRGCWSLEFEVTFGSGAQITWTGDRICVHADIA